MKLAAAAALILCILVLISTTNAQTTEFIYQGQLQSSSAPANGNFDFEFALFDGAGSQVGPTLSRNSVSVASGIFSVKLDFGASFSGASRFLEIRVRQSGGGAYTTLSPRQSVTSTPYSVKSLSADTADNAVNALTATNFSGILAGDVTGTQSTTTVVRLQNRNIASTQPLDGQVLKYSGSTNQWVPGTDDAGSGGGTITGVTTGAGLTGGGTTGSVNLAIANGGVGTNQVADGAITDSKIVSVNGIKVTGTVANATTAANLTGSFTGDVSGTQSSTSVQSVGGQTASSIGAAVQGVFAATSNGNPNTLVRRDAAGGFSAGIVDMTQLNLSGERAFGIFNTNTAAGRGSGPPNGVGTDNSYFGYFAGPLTTSGSSNSYFGFSAGRASSGSNRNSFFGSEAGMNNTGDANSFFGERAGMVNTAPANSFFGGRSGASNTSGNLNAFFGYRSGFANQVGSSNTLIGHSAGDDVTGSRNTYVGASTGTGTAAGSGNTYVGYNTGQHSGSNNTIIGSGSYAIASGINNAASIGALTRVDCSNCMVLGSISGVNGATAQTNVGIGTSFPRARLHVDSGSDVEPGNLGGFILTGDIGSTNVVIDDNEIMARDSGATATLALNADGGNVHLIQGGTGSVGIGTGNPDQKLSVNGNASKTGGTSWAVFSDVRLKNTKGRFTPGLDAIRQLNPIRFEYRADNALGLSDTSEQIGFSAQEVQKVLPEAVKSSTNGYLQLNSDPILWTMLNAIKEQQDQIENLKKMNNVQQNQINQLKRVVCSGARRSGACKERR